MEHRSLALVLALALAGPTIAGCVQDLERRQLDAGWQADVRVDEAPVREVHGAPAMLVASGPVSLPGDANVTLTGFDAELSRANASIDLEAMRVNTDEGTQRAGEAEGELALSAGDRLTVTFVPADDADRRADPRQDWNASVEVQWRYREDASFDAGRLEANATVSPDPVPDLGVGVVERDEGEVRRLVFEAIDTGPLPDAIPVEVLELGGGTVETLERTRAQANRSDGTARLAFDEPVAVPDGSGYLVLRLDGPNGTASTPLATSEEPMPSPGLGVALAAITGAALLARCRAGE